MPTRNLYITSLSLRTFLQGLLCLLLGGTTSAQPVFAERYEAAGVQFYPDLKDASLHYYLPLNIKGAVRPDGSPDFILIRTVAHREAEMTTTGILQFTLKRERMDVQKILQHARSHSAGVKMVRPLPISGFRMKLTDGRQRIGTLGTPAGDFASGRAAELGYWREKTFTVALTREAATLLTRQKDTTGSISFYLSYEVRANFIAARKAAPQISGTNALMTLDSITEPKYVLTNRVARSGAVKYVADIGNWGNRCYREIVVNYQNIPRYLPFSVGCYDFSDGLRPDLEAKAFRICGTGVTGREVCRDIEFSTETTWSESVTFRFPGPVLSNLPLRYKVTEITTSGAEKVSDWQTVEAGRHIDITTPLAERFLARKSIELYAEPEDLVAAGYVAAALLIEYELLGEPHRIELEIRGEDDDSFRTVDFHYDQRSPPTQRAWYALPDGSKHEKPVAPLEDSFIDLNPKQ